MITYEECVYKNAQKILQSLLQKDYLEKPVFIILRYIGTVRPNDILRMIVSLFLYNKLPTYPNLVSISGINIINDILSKNDSRILVSETIVSYSQCSTPRLPIQMQKQCERLYQCGCSVITTLPKSSEITELSQDLTIIGYNVIIQDEIDDIEVDLFSFTRKERIQSPDVDALLVPYRKCITEIASSDDCWKELTPDIPQGPQVLVYFPEKDQYITKYPMITYIGDIQVDCLEHPPTLGWVEAKLVYCPHCMKVILFGRDSQTDSFKFHPSCGSRPELILVDETAFRHHVEKCPQPFPADGIHEVQTDHQKQITAKLSLIAKRECGWDSPTFAVHSFERGARAFILIRNGVPAAYVGFQKKTCNDFGELYVLWDLYTFPEFRKQGLSSSLLDHAIEVLKIDKDSFFISFPVREGAKNIVMSRVGHNVGVVRGREYDIHEKEFVLEHWKDFKDQYD